MVQLWCVLGLIVSAFCVSILGAAFSVVGLGKLFSGAVVAVWLMASSLELAKFMIAAFLHQIWARLNFIFKAYLLIAVVVLSAITSMGIFGFLTAAYQESSTQLESETVKLESLKGEDARDNQEIARLQKAIDDIPNTRVTRKLEQRAIVEPQIQNLKKNLERVNAEITSAQLKILQTREKVGPLLYIAQAFHKDVDTVVKYLILLFVSVFDPLAICLVIAVGESLRLRAAHKEELAANAAAAAEAAPAISMRFAETEAANAETSNSEPATTDALATTQAEDGGAGTTPPDDPPGDGGQAAA